MAEEIALAGGGAAEMGGHSSTEGGLTPILAVTNSSRSSICYFFFIMSRSLCISSRASCVLLLLMQSRHTGELLKYCFANLPLQVSHLLRSEGMSDINGGRKFRQNTERAQSKYT